MKNIGQPGAEPASPMRAAYLVMYRCVHPFNGRGRVAARFWQRICLFVGGALLWGWGTASSAVAGCGDHLIVVVRDTERGTFRLVLPRMPDGSPPIPCPGPGCSEGPQLPKNAFLPIPFQETFKPSVVAWWVDSPAFGDNSSHSVYSCLVFQLQQGARLGVYHPPRRA